LRGADLRDAYLADADLAQADLWGAIVSEKQLATCSALTGAMLPDGTIHS